MQNKHQLEINDKSVKYLYLATLTDARTMHVCTDGWKGQKHNNAVAPKTGRGGIKVFDSNTCFVA